MADLVGEEELQGFKDEKWRLIITRTKSYKEQMGIDEANLLEVASGRSPPILRFCYFEKPSVAIGFFQSVEKEVNLEECEKQGIEVFRRMTGGGAVFKDPKKELNYTFVIREDDEKIPIDILESYEKICGAVIEGLKELGINPEFKPINDIVLNGKKISGNAQTRKQGTILQHGTILVDVDIEKMFSVLKISDEKIRDKMIESAKQRVTSINDELKKMGKKPVKLEDVQRAVTKGFEKVFDVEFKLDKLTKEEEEKARELYELKYNTDAWNFWR